MTIKYLVDITDTAQADIADMWLFIAADSPSAARRFVGEIEEKIFSLEELPERRPRISEEEILLTGLYRHLVHKNYRIVFRMHGNAVCVLRVLHGARLLTRDMLDE